MNIRWKVSALVAGLFAVLAVTELYVAKYVLVPSFSELEHRQADVAIRRVRYALDRSMEQLALSATSWGNWSDTYRFVQDHNRHFVAENITAIGLKQLDANAVLVVDLSGRLLAAAALDLESGQPLDLDLVRGEVLAANFPWRENLRQGRDARGFLQTNRGVLMLVASPILDGFGHGPARGSVVMGRLLAASQVRQIGAQAQARLVMLRPRSTAASHLVETADFTQVFETFSDIYGKPIFTMQVDLPREITQRGYSAVQYASMYLIGAAVLAVILLVIILNRVVLNPLARMTRHAVAIGQNEDLTQRLDFKGTDEIAVLAGEFDRMLAHVADSRGKLLDQSFEAGFSELAKGVLHNLGNAMTPVSVRLAVLRSRLRSLQMEDFELAAIELTRADADPERRRDLEEFVRLACGHLVSTIASAEQDLEVIGRQTALVQSALTEQLQSTRNEHVMEAVWLTDLLTQSLDVVPDSARQCLELRLDKSLQSVGVVCVPRTVLRLVIQNLIINAADAIRESGRSRGSLQIEAQVKTAADHRQLLIRCTDDGIGIAADNLERIFENGFSTKSRETNFGIGLHWCANAVSALGGRVWATSPGLGQGASLHVMIPLPVQEAVAATRAA